MSTHLASGTGAESSHDGTEDLEDLDEVVELRDLVAAHDGDVAAANATEDPYELAALAFDALLVPGSDRYTIDDVAELAGVDRAATLRLWRAMGFPDPPEGERLAGDHDVEALQLAVEQMVDHPGLDNGVRQTRILSAALARVTELWVDELRTALDAGLPVRTAAQYAVPMFDVERSGKLLTYVHRRLLAAGLRRELTSRSVGATVERAVAFADIVGFTTLTEELDTGELSHLIETFEALAYDTVAEHGGRVVKTIGDEVLYTCDDPLTVVTIAESMLSISSACGLPELRVGAELGVAVWYEGDLYGPAVNRASRIVEGARPGSLAASRAFSDAVPAKEWTDRGVHQLKGIGEVEVVELAEQDGCHDIGAPPLPPAPV